MEIVSQSTESQKVKVTILLSGGHQHTFYSYSNTPILKNLFQTLISRSRKQEIDSDRLFQISLDEQHSALCFPSENLIGLKTEPPVFIQDFQPETQFQETLDSQYIQIDNFLTSTETRQLLDYVFGQKSAFIPSSTSTNEANYRRSLVLHSFPEFSQLIISKVREILPDILNKLNLPLFSASQIETQLTAHNDGNYYKVHNDNGSPETATRELTYVYYFYQEPKAFSGGELLIYDSKIENSYYKKAETFQTVEPRNNSIVFFLSRYLHEVLPISCPSQDFKNSRFTINGWIRR